MEDINTDVHVLNLASCAVVVYNVAFCKKTLGAENAPNMDKLRAS
jgi:hypothetical protein